MTDEQKFLLTTTLSRIDIYLNSVNTKAAFIITFNTFIAGAIIVNGESIVSKITILPYPQIAGLCLVLMFFGIILSLFFILKSAAPFLSKGNTETYKSCIYFGSIADMPESEYLSAIHSLTSEGLQEDFARQIHLLSVAAKAKFDDVSTSIRWLLFGVILPLSLVFLLFVINFVFKLAG